MKAAALALQASLKVISTAIFMLQSAKRPSFYRQESFFFYLFGVEEEDYCGALNLATGETTLFMPQLQPTYAIWLGPIQVRMTNSIAQCDHV